MIRSERAHLYISAATHAGMKGKNNEDRYAVSAYHLGAHDPTPAVFAVVCDGIGGHRAGEVAAEMAVEKISHAVAQSDASQPVEVMRQAIAEASQAIREQAERSPAQKGMGATCVCAWVIGEQLYAGWVGDSRLYLIRGGAIQQITTDHTWVQEAIEFGALTPEQAKNHPNAHVIRRHLGSSAPVVPDFRLRLDGGSGQAEANQGLRLLPGDQLLLCSDGLTDLVEDGEILAAMKTQEREAALQGLIELANQRGGHDNITLVTLEAPVSKPVTRRLLYKDQRRASTRRLQMTLSCLGGIALLLALAALAAGGIFAAGWLRPATPTVTLTPTLTPPPTLTASPTPQPTLPPTAVSEATLTETPAPPIVISPIFETPAPTLTPWPTNTRPPGTDLPTLMVPSPPSP